MGTVIRNHELVEYSSYPCLFSPEMEVLRDVAKDNDGDVSKSISIETFNLSEDLDPSLDFTGEPVMRILYLLYWDFC
ncbi:hypothetical protein AYI68_g7295 [Smittium mucronatum]|uniref:Uncharacterized protein n=1 Tax=Smittium mucronatum TaxID=133383 RepID=A0A1R0GNU8_9FUNG|nr:hypothetical protein AYI68_g7401 [Smittium mucronatum]OLY78651.1 hypothetical protein AYI68_g7295 [Smittium mucronatum]